MSFSTVTFVDPCSDSIFSYDGKAFADLSSVPSKSFIASRVFYDDIISYSFKVSKNTSIEEIKSSLEIKMYEEAGLDLDKEYKMTHVIKDLEFEDMLLVEAFAIEKSATQERLKTVLQKTKYLDFLALPFLSFTTLYTHKIIAAKNDVFVFLEEDEGFLSIYKDGKYLSAKSLPSLADMQERFAKEDIDINSTQLYDLLREKGLDPEAYGREDAQYFTVLEAIFSEIFTKINNVITHNRSVFGIDKVDRLFFGTREGRIKGLAQFSNNFFSSELKLLDLNLLPEKVQSDFFARIVASYAYDISRADTIDQDITFFQRKAAFSKSETGKFTIFIAALLLLGSIYPLYLKYDIALLQEQSATLSEQLSSIKTSTQALRSQIKQAQDTLDAATKERTQEEQRIANISASIQDLYTLKVKQKGVIDFVVSINDLLQKYGLKSRSIELSDSDHLRIELYSSSQKRDTIAKFMRDLLANGFVQVHTEEIRADAQNYISIVEIAR